MTLERLLAMVSDDDFETLRDAILREEGRRRTQYQLNLKMPFPPFDPGHDRAAAVHRWARMLAWLATDRGIPPAEGQRGVIVRIVTDPESTITVANPEDAAILLQEALVEAGLLLGRTPEWMTATGIESSFGDENMVHITLWDRGSAADPATWT